MTLLPEKEAKIMVDMNMIIAGNILSLLKKQNKKQGAGYPAPVSNIKKTDRSCECSQDK